MVDHRPSNYGLQAPQLNRGPTTAALTGHFFLIPFLNLPHVWPHAVMKLSLRTAFLQAKSALAFDAWFFYYTREHIKNLPPSNGIICMKGNCPTIYLPLCHSIFSQGHAQKKKRKERTQKRRGILVRAAEASTPPSFPCFKSNYFFPAFVIFLGAFQRNCTWKLVTKQHIHTFHQHEGSLKFSKPEG